MTTPHDAFYKKIFTEKPVAKGFFQQNLPEEVSNGLDWRTLKLCQTNFVDENMKQSASDIVYTIKAKVSDATVYLLCEHQSKPDKAMPLRLMEYTLRICRDHLNQGQKKLPIVIPFVLYNGIRKYPYSHEFSAYFEDPELAEMTMFNHFRLVDLTQYSDEELSAYPETAVLTLAMKHIVKGNLEEFKNLLNSEIIQNLDTDESKLHWVIYYAIDALGVDVREQAIKMIKQMKKGKKMISIGESFRQEGRQEGETHGAEKALCAVELYQQGYTDVEIQEKLHLSKDLLKVIKTKYKQLF